MDRRHENSRISRYQKPLVVALSVASAATLCLVVWREACPPEYAPTQVSHAAYLQGELTASPGQPLPGQPLSVQTVLAQSAIRRLPPVEQEPVEQEPVEQDPANYSPQYNQPIPRSEFPTVTEEAPPWAPLFPEDVSTQEPTTNVPDIRRLPALPVNDTAPVENSSEQRPEDLDVVRGEVNTLLLGEPSETIMRLPPVDEPTEVSANDENDDTDAVIEPATPRRLPKTSTVSDRVVDAAMQRADRHVRQGLALANRGATFSARAEFIDGLRIIANTLDRQQATQQHSQALAAGMQLAEESRDFIPRPGRLDSDLDIEALIQSHTSTVLKDTVLKDTVPKDDQPTTAHDALVAYQREGRIQLALAIGDHQVGSLALFALGKLQTATPPTSKQREEVQIAQAEIFQGAAVDVDSNNFLAANELGVLLASRGELQQARDLLHRSIAIAPLRETWHNLAVVHSRLGENDLAAQAHSQWRLAGRSPTTLTGKSPSDSSPVRWVNTRTFQSSATADGSLHRAVRPQPMTTPPADDKTAKSGLPWSIWKQ